MSKSVVLVQWLDQAIHGRQEQDRLANQLLLVDTAVWKVVGSDGKGTTKNTQGTAGKGQALEATHIMLNVILAMLTQSYPSVKGLQKLYMLWETSRLAW
jgi:hypothetical protein